MEHVTVLEFLPELKADEVLQNRLKSLSNITVITNAETKEITGNEKVNGITYIDRSTGKKHSVKLMEYLYKLALYQIPVG